MDSCEIKGTVINLKEGKASIQTVPNEACAGCGGKMLCGSAKARILEVPARHEYDAGQKVKLTIPFRSGLVMTFFLYALGTIAGIIVAALIYWFSNSDIFSAVIFLTFELAWIISAPRAMRAYADKSITVERE